MLDKHCIQSGSSKFEFRLLALNIFAIYTFPRANNGCLSKHKTFNKSTNNSAFLTVQMTLHQKHLITCKAIQFYRLIKEFVGIHNKIHTRCTQICIFILYRSQAISNNFLPRIKKLITISVTPQRENLK